MTTHEENSSWSQRDIFWLGYFGPNTVAARRYRNRSLSALGMLLVVQALSALLHDVSWFRFVAAAAPGLMFGWIALEWWRYIQSLDELARRLQVEAMAWTYIVGVFAMMAMGGVCMAFGTKLNPSLFILLELVRAHRLSVLARRH